MRRRLFIITAFLLGGTIVNVVLAAWIGEYHELPRIVEAWDRYYQSRPYFAFTISTLYYAALLWLLTCGPFALRRLIRRRSGRCEKCGYPIGKKL